MAEIAVAILGKVSELLVAPLGRQLGYFFQFTRNVETLKNELDQLRNLKDDLKQEVGVALNNVDNILNTVETWLDRADLVDKEAQSIVEDKVRFPKGCLNNWCLNLKSRYVLSRRAKKRTQDIIELQQEGKFPKVSVPVPPEFFMGSTSTAFDSREFILNKIIESLKDEDINMIGICGMGGMGKTTMAEKVLKRVKEENMFDDYAMTVVSQRAETINVQRDIAEMLGLRLEENNPVLRASRLNQRLDGKKVLIIVDDVWEEFDLRSLGITLQDGQRKCKVVFTSRIQGLWMDFRSGRHELSLDPLTDNESWKLFTQKIGNFLDDNSEFVSVAQQIVNECAGLPLALVTLGLALLGKNKHAWKDTLLKLRTISGAQQKVYESIRLSYDHLGDEEAKSLFLLCSLFKEDSSIDVERLVSMGMGLRLFRGINRVEAARDRVFALVEHLQSRCLISVKFAGIVNRSRTHLRAKCFVKVHDVVLDVSKSIASTEKGSLVIEHDVTLETLLEQSFVEHCTWISVISEENKELPPILQFPRLKLLLWNNKDGRIPDSCFEGMVKIQVVDIRCSNPYLYKSYTVLKLPSSLQSLTSLHTLCLRDFRLEGLAAIKYLQNLEILLIADSFIEELPKEIGELTKLRLLDVSDCNNLRKASPGAISGLSNLEELYLGGLDTDWGGENSEKGRNALREFESLSKLRILNILIKDPRVLPRTPVFRYLKKYQIHIGHSQHNLGYTYDSQNFERILSVCNVDLDKDFDFLVHNSEALLLEGKSTKRLVYELVQGVSQSLKCLEICDTDTLEYLVNMTDRTKASFLVSMLESLTLQGLNNLQQITNRPLVTGNIAKLKKLVVRNCKQLRSIFWLSNASDVLQLEKLHVSDCESMEEVICWEGREEDSTRKLQFPKLMDLELGGKSLVCFCKGAKEIELHQLKELSLTGIESIISISDEIRVNSIFSSKVFLPSLVEMRLLRLKNMKEIWCGQLESGSFYNLSRLVIDGCNSLEYIFSPYTARYLVHLRTLIIINCQNLKEIVSVPLTVGILVKLKFLHVKRCNQMRNIFQLSTAMDTMDLEYLLINTCESMEEVISWEGRPEDATSKLLFPKLRSMDIKSASSLICFCKRAMEIEFHQLTSFHLKNIPAVKCLVSISNENSLKSIFPHKVSFGRVEEISLCGLKNMKEIWCGQLQAGSFDNLSVLEISECDSLEYVFSPCTARYLVHLRKLFIFACKHLKEVILASKEVAEVEDYTRIILPKLEKVRLYKLLSLERFYHVANEIELPKLCYVGVVDCPVFKSFSPGFVHTPILNHVNLVDHRISGTKEEEKVTMWKGNLNSTIRHLHEEQQQTRQRKNEHKDEKESSSEKDIKEEI